MQVNALFCPPLFPQIPKVIFHLLLHLVREDNLICDVEIPEFVLVARALAILVPFGHAFARDRLDVAALYHLAAGAAETDNMRIEMSNVARPATHPRLAEGQHFRPVQVIAFAAKVSAVYLVGIVFGCRLFFRKSNNEVARNPVGALVGFVFVHNLGVASGTPFNLESDRRWLPLDSLAITNGTLVLDALATTSARIASHLHLLEHAWGELLLDNANAMSAANRARIDLAVCTACSLTGLAYVLPVPLELGRGTIVEVAKRDLYLYVDVVAAGFLGGMAVMTMATEESTEQVKGVVEAAALAAVLVLLDAIVAVTVVNLAEFGVAQDFVCLR